MHRVDYDTIAHLYDERIRDHAADERLLAFLETRSRTSAPQVRVLDVGCGTGKQLAANRERLPDTALVGVDRFAEMLRIARRRCPAVPLIQADGAALPLRPRTFDYVTSQYSYQHIRRHRQFLGEVARVLRPGGRFAMINIDPWSMPGWLVYRYFPEARALDEQDFLPADAFAALMREVGFRDVRITRDDLSKPESLRTFLAWASDRHRASQFMAISEAAYGAGLRRVQEALAAAPGGDVEVPSEFVLLTVVGERQPNGHGYGGEGAL